MANEQVSALMCVKSHASAIYRKTGIHDQRQVISLVEEALAPRE